MRIGDARTPNDARSGESVKDGANAVGGPALDTSGLPVRRSGLAVHRALSDRVNGDEFAMAFFFFMVRSPEGGRFTLPAPARQIDDERAAEVLA